MSVRGGIWRSRERESAMMLCLPGICCEYRLESLRMSDAARYLAVVSWWGIDVGKEALKSQPRALLLSVKARIFWLFFPWFKVSSIVITAAMNSNRFIENFSMCSCGISNRHANPFSL